MRKKLFDGVEEVIDTAARHFEFDKPDWKIENPGQRMMYIPKDTVAAYMKQIEAESLKRINKYRDYAQNMKFKFDEYEKQSERYYSEMLEAFKDQARKTVQAKVLMIDKINQQVIDRDAKIIRIKERIVEKSYKGLMSDVEDSPEEELVPEKEEHLDINVYKQLKQTKQAKKQKVTAWITKFKQENKRDPTQVDTDPIKVELQAYDDAEKAYLRYKLKLMIKEQFPFEITEFYTLITENLEKTQNDFQFQATKGSKDQQIAQQQQVMKNYIAQLQSEVEELRNTLAQTDKTGKMAQYIEILKQRDNLVMERTLKLEEISRLNKLQNDEKKQLEAKLQEKSTVDLINKAKGGVETGYSVASLGNQIQNIQLQNQDLLDQIKKLNLFNTTMLAKIKAMGGKGLSADELKEIENDINDCQQRMLDGIKDQHEAQTRTIQAIENEMKVVKSQAVGDPAALESKVNEIKQIQTEFENEVKRKQSQIDQIEVENKTLAQNFKNELQKVQSEFLQLEKESMEEQNQMRQKIKDLEKQQKSVPLNKQNTSGADENHKTQIQTMKVEFDKQLKTTARKIEDLDGIVATQLSQSNLYTKELGELREKLAESLKTNKLLQIKLSQYAEAAGETKSLKEKASILKQHLKEATAELDIVSTKYKEEQVKRKKLLNELEDMKGKVRVYCRIRPFSNQEKTVADRAMPCVNITDEVSLTVGTQKNRMKDYQFDAVFGMNSTQEEVFEDTRRLIQSAIDGFNVCIFAYGQTGSGKTFTIQGSPEQPGLTPRSIVEMFEILKTMTNFDIKLKCYMVELYLNALRDLLKPKEEAIHELIVKESATGMVSIEGVTEVELTSISQTEQIFEDGLAGRKTRKTQMNDASSRSHLVFSIIVDSTNVNTGVRTIGKLSFVDLAGSEKSSKTGTDVQGQEEANAINLSLSALGNVIAALSDGSKFIPYRNHILTKLMKDSLGGTAKTLMFVNCSPSAYNESETKNSLDYAVRVKKIKNNVNKNVESKEDGKYRDALNQMDSMMEKLKSLLRNSDKAAEWAALEMEINKPLHPEEDHQNA